MTRQENWRKFWNRSENSLLSLRLKLLILFGMFPSISKGYEKLKGKEYKLSFKIDLSKFYPITRGNWGSARNDMDSVFDKDGYYIEGDTIHIRIFKEQRSGKPFGTTEDPPNWVMKPTVTASILQDGFAIEGLYTAELKFDLGSLGSWDAWWFFRKNRSGEIGYNEFDMMERFYGRDNEKRILTTTIHHSKKGKAEGAMMNGSYKLPKKEDKVMQAIEFIDKGFNIYLNGVLVWKNRLWPQKESLGNKTMTMIVGSGLQEKMFHYADPILSKREYFFEVSNIRHWIKK